MLLQQKHTITEIPTQSVLVERALDEFERPLLAYANSILNDVEGARDAVQDTFIKLYKQDEGAIGAGIKSWLFTVCRNRCFDMLRKRRRQTVVDFSELNPVDERAEDPRQVVSDVETVQDVMRFLERLPDNQREVIRLKFQQGLSYKEISKTTGLSVSNVGFLLHMGLKRLRKLMNHLAEGE